MGKTLRWFRALLGAKKSSDSPAAPSGSELSRPTKEKKWGFVRSFNGNDRNIGERKGSYAEASSSGTYVEAIEANKHAIAVAAATAAVAEAALAAAQAAAEVVRLTSGGGSRPATAYVGGSDRPRELAAVKIQSAFRAYLARRALRALKGLVRLQALVRGHIVRKQSADMLRRMQAMARIQARACTNRAHMSESSLSSSKSFQSCNAGLATPKNYDNQLRAFGTKSDQSLILKSSQSNIKTKGNVDPERTHSDSNWLNRWMEECSWNSQGDTSLKTGHADDERSDKILEVDTWKPHLNSQRSDKNFMTPQYVKGCNYNDHSVTIFDSLSSHSTRAQKQNPSISSGEVLSLRSLKFPRQGDQAAVRTSENSPQVNSASSRPGSSGRRGPFTPARSECSRSFFSNYPGYPNYMANTEASQAKIRSQSAPRPRMEFQKFSPTKRFVRGFWDADTLSERGSPLQANFKTKAYPGSGRMDRPGMPVRGNSTASYNSSYGGR